MTEDSSNELYHFTTFEGAMGILQSQTLWATHYEFLNDTTEIIFAKEILKQKYLPEIIKHLEEITANPSKYPKEQISFCNNELKKMKTTPDKVVVDSLYTPFFRFYDGPYITCFSAPSDNTENCKDIERNGLLSQWRGYGKNGGCCLVFNKNKLQDKLKNEQETYSYKHLDFHTIQYGNSKLEKLEKHIEEIITIEKEQYTHNSNGMNKNDWKHYKNIPKEHLINCIFSLKHHSFFEENEVRIVALRNNKNNQYIPHGRSIHNAEYIPEDTKKDKEVCFGNKPYLELLKQKENKDDLFELPIERIIVGPHNEQKKRTKYLQMFLKAKGKKNIHVGISQIPFID